MKNRKSRHRGNVKAQEERRKERLKHLPPKQKEKHELIDGNFSYYPVAECRCHGAWLTQGLAETHRCVERQCSGYKVIQDEAAE